MEVVHSYCNKLMYSVQWVVQHYIYTCLVLLGLCTCNGLFDYWIADLHISVIYFFSIRYSLCCILLVAYSRTEFLVFISQDSRRKLHQNVLKLAGNLVAPSGTT